MSDTPASEGARLNFYFGGIAGVLVEATASRNINNSVRSIEVVCGSFRIYPTAPDRTRAQIESHCVGPRTLYAYLSKGGESLTRNLIAAGPARQSLLPLNRSTGGGRPSADK